MTNDPLAQVERLNTWSQSNTFDDEHCRFCGTTDELIADEDPITGAWYMICGTCDPD